MSRNPSIDRSLFFLYVGIPHGTLFNQNDPIARNLEKFRNHRSRKRGSETDFYS